MSINKNYYADMDIGIDTPLRDNNYLSTLVPQSKLAGHFEVDPKDLSDQFMQWLDKHDLFPNYSEIFYCGPGGKIFMHADDIEPPNAAKINWVFDQDKTWMRWYDLKPGKNLIRQDNFLGGIYYISEEGDFEFACQHRVQKPTLVNAGILHDVINPSKHPRWCISIVPQRRNTQVRLTWNEATELFAPYIQP